MDKNRRKIIAVDFDGSITTIVKDPHLLLDFELRPNVKEVLQWIKQHFFLILWTCRDGQGLQIALNFLNKHEIKFDAINENAPFVDFKTSRKILYDKLIDDKCNPDIDWLKVQHDLCQEFLQTDDEKIVHDVVKVIVC
jgi:hypothetical protein